MSCSDSEHQDDCARAWARRCRRKRIKHALEAPFEWLGIAMGALILVPLPHRLLLAICDGLAALFYAVDRQGRNRSLENLHILKGTCVGLEGTPAFDPAKASYSPTASEAILVRRSYRNMVRTIGHVFWTSFFARRRVSAVGEMCERGTEFLRQNRPAVTVSGHLGCWEILSQLAFLEGHRMMSVAKRIGSARTTRLLMRSRMSIGQEIVPADGAFKALMKGLKDGKSLGLLVDQHVDPDDGGLWIRFLGRPMPVSAAPAFFSAKTKVPIVVAWSHPLKNGHYRCEVVDSIISDEARDIWATTQRIARDLEHIIRRHPSCWILNYNYFSNIPEEEHLKGLAARERKIGD